jgi:hypothetical protein
VAIGGARVRRARRPAIRRTLLITDDDQETDALLGEVETEVPRLLDKSASSEPPAPGL